MQLSKTRFLRWPLPRLMLLVLAFSACRSPQIAVVESPKIPKEERVDTVFMHMKMNELRFENMQAKFSASYEVDGSTQSFGGQIRIRRDSAIWVSISPGLGIEVIRVLVSQDSVKMLNKIKKNFFATKGDYINKMLNTDLDFEMLQSLLLGCDFPYYETNVFETGLAGKEYKLSTVSRHKLKKLVKTNEDYEKVLVQNMWIDKDSYKITRQSVKQVKDLNKKLEVEYSNFNLVGDQLFAHTIQLRLEDKTIVKINLEYSKILLNEEISFPMKIPESYNILLIPE